MPDFNFKYFRLYGHYMCPFVERVRLVLAAKKIPYQDCQVNLDDRTKWHKEVNGGFVPILEVPPDLDTSKEGLVICESLNIMEFLEMLTGEEPFCRHM
jgi:glutathione S-transferase